MTQVRTPVTDHDIFAIWTLGAASMAVFHLLASEVVPKLWRRKKAFHLLLFCAYVAEVSWFIPEFVQYMFHILGNSAALQSGKDDPEEHYADPPFDVAWISLVRTIQVTALPFRVLAQLVRVMAVVFSLRCKQMVKLAIGFSVFLLLGRVLNSLDWHGEWSIMLWMVVDLIIVMLLRAIALASDGLFMYRYINIRHRAMQSRETLHMTEARQAISSLSYDNYSYVATASGSDGISDSDQELLIPSYLKYPKPRLSYKLAAIRRPSTSSNFIPSSLTPKYWYEQTHRQAKRIHAPVLLLALMLLQLILEILQSAFAVAEFIHYMMRYQSTGFFVYMIAFTETTFIISLYCVTCVNDKIANLAQEQQRQQVRPLVPSTRQPQIS